MTGAHTLVLGAGAAGSVIAARLSERSDLSVCLIEAGPDHPPHQALPADLADGRRNSMTDHDWGYAHQPTPWSGLFPLPRGKVVGGSSAVNTCIALRGQPADFDEWAARGLDDWAWERCLPAFRRLETDLDFPDDPWHGDEGPLPLRRHPIDELVPWQAAFLEACEQLGFPACADSNRPGSTGWGPHAMNKTRGRRISAAQAWLTSTVRSRDNLTIRARTLVRRILFRGGRVRGVEIESAVGGVEVLACERVVLCGGALGTPGVLLRSGVGPRAEVERLGVELVRDVPAVGSQLLDHPGSALFFVPRRRLAWSAEDPLIQTVLRTRLPGGPVQIQAGSNVPTSRWGMLRAVSLMVHLCKPRSIGRLVFRSADPLQRPLVHSRLQTDPADRELTAQALHLCHRLSRAPAMRRLARGVLPGRLVAGSTRALRAWVTIATDSSYHLCGTVPMGRATDGRGRIDGIEGLRVADASLFPTVPGSNIHLPTLMLGERFGEWLREDLD
jgi:choline dehydrogenase